MDTIHSKKKKNRTVLAVCAHCLKSMNNKYRAMWKTNTQEWVNIMSLAEQNDDIYKPVAFLLLAYDVKHLFWTLEAILALVHGFSLGSWMVLSGSRATRLSKTPHFAFPELLSLISNSSAHSTQCPGHLPWVVLKVSPPWRPSDIGLT